MKKYIFNAIQVFRSQERILWESDSGKKISLIREGPARRNLPLMTHAVV